MLTQNIQDNFPQPFLKWAGGKSKLIQQYVPYFPKKFKTYHEPFLGGGAVFFYLYRSQPSIKSFITDINPDLINAYCCVKNNVEDLILLLEEHQLKHNKDYYYYMRSRQVGSWDECCRTKSSEKEQTLVEKAARLIYLNKTCFNGLYRENSKGEFNVPIGNYKNPRICNSDLLRSVSASLQSAEIKVSSFDNVLTCATGSEDFVYFDPPYYPISDTSNFTSYSRDSFNEDEQIKLKDTFTELAKHGVKVMLSNSDCPFIRNIYREFNITEILASRAINSNAKRRGKIPELLITSY